MKKERRGWDTSPPKKIISQASFWDDADQDVFAMARDMTNKIDWSKVSHALMHKLFMVVEIWQKDGVLCMPALHYVIKKSRKNLGDDSAKLFFNLRTEQMPKLLAPLTWVEYLHRKGG